VTVERLALVDDRGRATPVFHPATTPDADAGAGVDLANAAITM
jgi:hypothetical protein